jgi:L-asparaginase
MTSSSHPSSLRLIACGGTFDKRYDPIRGELVFTATQLTAIVERVRLTIPVTVEALMQIDSLDMQPADRERVLASCRAAGEAAIVITHGTDTMPETAAVLGAQFDAQPSDAAGKTIVLTGAMVPYSISGSDALFNLGFACAAAQTLPAGVWIAMNGRVHRWDDVRKNREAGVFEPLAR